MGIRGRVISIVVASFILTITAIITAVIIIVFSIAIAVDIIHLTIVVREAAGRLFAAFAVLMDTGATLTGQMCLSFKQSCGQLL